MKITALSIVSTLALLVGCAPAAGYKTPKRDAPHAMMSFKQSWGDDTKTANKDQHQYFFVLNPDSCEISGLITSFHSASRKGPLITKRIAVDRSLTILNVVSDANMNLDPSVGDKVSRSNKVDCYSIDSFTPEQGGYYTHETDYKTHNNCKTLVKSRKGNKAPANFDNVAMDCDKDKLEDEIWENTFKAPGLTRDQQYVFSSYIKEAALSK